MEVRSVFIILWASKILLDIRGAKLIRGASKEKFINLRTPNVNQTFSTLSLD